ncbi:MAG: hypothetical protein GY913_23220 [Proteobacteria bacterium]|nr:hypothetical protein [Pseudomonadota bacterium]MCP4919823.1 hypothetical protein [Pseudomonadota bacterium]
MLLVLLACNDGSDDWLSAEELADPATCAGCHPDHTDQWSGSMHAYASTDLVFRAMNERGQRETSGQLGGDCVSCHAPMAVTLGLTEDGLNLDEIDDAYQGVPCLSCHGAVGFEESPLEVVQDQVLRGPLDDAIANPAHGSAYSTLHDRDEPDSATMCGTCHDRSFQEWRQTVFSYDQPDTMLTCSSCHMPGTEGSVAVDGPVRRTHDHSVPGLDLALTDFPNRDEQRELVQHELDSSVLTALCVTPGDDATAVRVDLENIAAGHNLPSCSRDRRGWVEVIGYAEGAVVYESGVVAEGQTVDDGGEMWRFGDRYVDATGESVLMPWDAAAVATDGLEAASLDGTDNHLSRDYTLPAGVDRVTLRVLLRPIGLDVIDDLAQTGDLDATLGDDLPTLELGGTVLEWTDEEGPCSE